MDIFSLTPQENQNAQILSDEPVRKSPGFWSGSLKAPFLGIGAIASDIGLAVDTMTPAGMVWDPASEGYVPGGALGLTPEQTQAKRQQQHEAALEMSRYFMPDPNTTGTAGNVLFGLTNVVPEAMILTPYGAGALQGNKAYQMNRAEGVDAGTAAAVGVIEGIATTAGFKIPMGLFPKAGFLKNAAANVAGFEAVGMASRGGVGAVLRANGYDEMADHYQVLDGTAMLTDAAMAVGFSALHHLPTMLKRSTPEQTGGAGGANVKMNPVNGFATPENMASMAQARLAELTRKRDGTQEQTVTGPDGQPMTIPGEPAQFLTPEEKAEIDFLERTGTDPEALAKAYNIGLVDAETQAKIDSAINAALTGNNQVHAEIDTAPGIPTDMETRQAHNDALRGTIDALMNGEDPPLPPEGAVNGNFIPNTEANTARLEMNAAIEQHVSDITGLQRELEARGLPTDIELYSPAWHGSPHRFLRFDLSKIGTGEGAQYYGWGAYLGDARAVAQTYRQVAGANPFSGFDNYVMSAASRERVSELARAAEARKDGTWWIYDELLTGDFPPNVLRRQIERLHQDGEIDAQELARSLSALEEAVAAAEEHKGYLYSVDIPDDAIPLMLDWDKPLSEQPAIWGKLEMRVEKNPDPLPGEQWIITGSDLRGGREAYDAVATKKAAEAYLTQMTGGDFYKSLSVRRGAMNTSLALNEIGVPGLRYLDNGSRGAGEGTRNTVVWDQPLLDRISDSMSMSEDIFSPGSSPVRPTERVRAMLAEHAKTGDTETLLRQLGELKGDLEERVARNDAKADGELERGELWVRERLLRAERKGEITPEQHALVKWLLDQNPALANDLALSFRSGGGDAAGSYNPAMRLATFFKGRGDPMTTAHEILHHAERMMPQDIRLGVRQEWIANLQSLRDMAAENGDQNLLAAIGDAVRAAAGDRKAYEAITSRISAGELPRDLYQFVNPSEYWAVNAARLVRDRANATGWVAKAVQWMKEFIEKAKAAFGLDSNAAVIRALDAVLKGDGTLSGRMLTDMSGDLFAVDRNSVDTHVLGVSRNERTVGKAVRFSDEERKAIDVASKDTKISKKEIESTVRAAKLAHPQKDGWSPLEFIGIKSEIDEDTGKNVIEYRYRNTPYAFNADSSGNALKPGTPEYEKRVFALGKRMVEEVRSIFARAQNKDAAAEKILAQAAWYKQMRSRLRHEFGGLGDLFADLLGATSPNTPVRGNWSNAIDSLRRATRGDFDALLPKWLEWSNTIDRKETEFRAWFTEREAENDAAWNDLDKRIKSAVEARDVARKEYEAAQKAENPTLKMGEIRAQDAWKAIGTDAIKALREEGKRYSKKAIKESPEYTAFREELSKLRELPEELMPTKESGKKYGFNGKNVVRALIDLWRVVKNADADIGRGGTAPKALNFSGNLIGFRSRATIDVWAARMLQRLAGMLRIPSVAEGSLSGEMRSTGLATLQFGFGQDVFTDAVSRIRNDAELKTDRNLAEVNDDDLQAIVWFVEKEIWTRHNWTSAAGEGGSFEFEADLTGSAQQDRIVELRKTIDSTQSTADQKAAALAELKGLSRSVDRYTGGLSIEQSVENQGVNFVPSDADMAQLQNRVITSVYEADDGATVLATKALSTEGRYGAVERSLDLEVVTREGYNPSRLQAAMLTDALAAKQDSTFLSRVLRHDETPDPLFHRPGVEIYFREGKAIQQLEPLLTSLKQVGVEFYTVIVDGRRMPEGMAGEMPAAVGVRLQHIPEFDARYGDGESMLRMTDAELSAKLQQADDDLVALADRVMREVEGVTFAQRLWYATDVRFEHEYQRTIDGLTSRIAGGADSAAGAASWHGRSVREGIESAVVQSRKTSGTDGGNGALLGEPGDATGRNAVASQGKAASGDAPEVISERPGIMVPSESGEPVPAVRLLEEADAEIAKAQQDSQGFEAAVACELRG